MNSSGSRHLIRLRKEADAINNNFKGVLELNIVDTNTMSPWHIKFVGAEGTVYAGESYTL